MLRRWNLLLVAGIAGIAGCGGTGNVSGKVYLQEAPVTSGNVFFYQKGSNSVTAPIGADGSYRAENVPTGTVKVAILPEPGGGGAVNAKAVGMMKGMQKTVGKEQAAVADIAAAKKSVAFTIPEKYQDAEKSEITVTVSKGDNSFDIKLK